MSQSAEPQVPPLIPHEPAGPAAAYADSMRTRRLEIAGRGCRSACSSCEWPLGSTRSFLRANAFALGNAGNHAQGCLFVDGERLRTPALEAWVITACAGARGFNYGRLDVRFPDEASCMRGEGGAILEANGVTSESTNMYDPSSGAVRAWGVMMAHWRAAFRIGAENRRAGVAGMSLREVLRRHRAWRATACGGDGAVAD